MESNRNIKKLDWVSCLLICIAIVFVIASFILPFLFTHFSFLNFTETGEIGDTIGGIMNPFVSIASVAVMLLAFYMQFEANKILKDELVQQKRQADRDRFESRFYELLKIHKDNSSVITNRIRGGFKQLVKDINSDYENARKSIIRNSYFLSSEECGENEHQTFLRVYDNKWNDSFGHYFRHLFLLVKFVVKRTDLFSYEEQRDYLRIVRASLSTYEQIYLYYNWLSNYGEKWEENGEGNKFFSDYRMIHNIDPDLIISEFTFNKWPYFKELLGNKSYKKEKDNANDNLFEHE